jgi:hypothetical protein
MYSFRSAVISCIMKRMEKRHDFPQAHDYSVPPEYSPAVYRKLLVLQTPAVRTVDSGDNSAMIRI